MLVWRFETIHGNRCGALCLDSTVIYGHGVSTRVSLHVLRYAREVHVRARVFYRFLGLFHGLPCRYTVRTFNGGRERSLCTTPHRYRRNRWHRNDTIFPDSFETEARHAKRKWFSHWKLQQRLLRRTVATATGSNFLWYKNPHKISFSQIFARVDQSIAVILAWSLDEWKLCPSSNFALSFCTFVAVRRLYNRCILTTVNWRLSYG